MKKLISIAVLSHLISSTVFAAWAMIPLDELVNDTDLVLIGTLHSAREDSDFNGRGYIRVERVIGDGASTLESRPLRPGDNLKLTWKDNWGCAMGMHLRWESKKGIWLLKIQKDGSVIAGHPGRFRQLDDFDEIESHLGRKQERNARRVDISTVINEKKLAIIGDSQNEIRAVDVSPFADYSPTQALVVATISLGLYWVLYRSRFRIR